MKSLMTKLALPLTLALGLISNAFAADYDYFQSGPVFSQDAYLVGGIGEVDTFYFTNTSGSGDYHFYSTSSIDLVGTAYSDTFAYTLGTNDDGAYSLNFCVDALILNNEAVTISVEGFGLNTEGDYTVIGAAGTCASDSAVNAAPSTITTTVDIIDSGAFGLPAFLFTILALGAVRLRRFFA